MATTTVLDDGRVFPLCDGEVLSWSIGLYMTTAQMFEKYPKACAVIRAMKQHRPSDLARERRSMLKGSFDKIFGHNAKAVLDSDKLPQATEGCDYCLYRKSVQDVLLPFQKSE